MKNILTGFAIFVCVIMLLGTLQHYESTYDRTATIVNHKDNTTLCVDSQGNLWEYDDCIGNKGDEITLIMHDNCTSGYIYDDIILEVKQLWNTYLQKKLQMNLAKNTIK